MSIILLLLLVTSSVVVCYDELNDHLVINQLEDNQLGHLEIPIPTPTRASRTQGVKKIRFCGRRLAGFIFATCGECEPGHSESLSLLCCAQSCSIEDIIEACCPNSFRK